MNTQVASKSQNLSTAGFSIPTKLADFPAVPRPGVLLTLEQEQAFGFTMLQMTLAQIRAMACDLEVVEAMLDEVEGAFTKGDKADKAVSLVCVDGLWVRCGSVPDAEFSREAKALLSKARTALAAVKRIGANERDLFYVSAITRLRQALSAIVPYDLILTKAGSAFKSKCSELNAACKSLVEYISNEMHISKPMARKVCEPYWLSNRLPAISVSANRYVQSLMPAKAKREFRLGIVERQQRIAKLALCSGVPVAELLACWSSFNINAQKMDRLAGTFAQMNTRLAEKIASQYRFASDFDQVRSAAYQGLARAIGLYAPEKGLKFSTYAVTWIKQTVLRDLIQQEIVRLPEGSHAMLTRVRAVYADMPNASDAYICTAASISMRELEGLRPYLLGTGALSMDSSLNSDGEESGLHVLIADENNDFVRDVEEESESAHITALIKSALLEREYAVLKHRMGLEGATPKTVVEVAAMVGTSPQNVSRIEKVAQAKLAGMPGLMEAWLDLEHV